MELLYIMNISNPYMFRKLNVSGRKLLSNFTHSGISLTVSLTASEKWMESTF